jgi:hypothetical protein
MWGKKEERGAAARFCLFTQGFLTALVMGLFVIGKKEEEEEKRRNQKKRTPDEPHHLV